MPSLARALSFACFALPLMAAAPSGTPQLANTPAAADLDVLFNHLKQAQSPEEAKPIESMIATIWAHSPSDTANLLYQRGLVALAANDEQLAYDLFTAVTSLQPDFAEGWHQLGAVNFAMNAHDEALDDLEHVLKLEPREYDAMTGLASIFAMYGNKKAALKALRRAYAVDPQIDGLKGRIDALSREVEGQGI